MGGGGAYYQRAMRQHPLLEPSRLRELTAEARDHLRELTAEARDHLRELPAGIARRSLPRELDPAALARIRAQRIADVTPGADPSGESRPRIVIVGGQQGSGKTSVQKQVFAAMPRGSVFYDGDDTATLHPDYAAVMRADDVTGHGIIAETLPVHTACMEHVRAHGFSLAASHPLGRVEWARAWVDGFRAAGCHVTAALLAVPSAASLLGAADRYQRSRDQQGFGRWVRTEQHDESYAGLSDVAHDLETGGHVDALYVLSRSGAVTHANQLGGDGRMRGAAGVARALAAERERARTAAEVRDFSARLAGLRDTAAHAASVPEWVLEAAADAEERAAR
ncbi:zeta toxin [Haloactinospora alba]|uniref:UDP-N-acetylglucosamine kinase n=2 Tax=Haloactinospora alba TaxID=405555 RepID=A0A543NMF0_9ACTN|nr:zeta toxin [Haloactinospora alba]